MSTLNDMSTSVSFHLYQPDQDDQDEDAALQMPGSFQQIQEPSRYRPANLSIFRVGFAGRGRGRGI